jgi:diadenosine tetraphosphate (Ap4A) HIT family hydrolase
MLKKSLYILLGLLVFSMGLYYLTPSAKLSRDYCAFCDPKIIEAQKFYEDDTIVALYTHKPVMPGHCLIIPKRHSERFEQITDQESLSISRAIKKIDQAAVKVFNTSSYLLLQKNGAEAGQTTPHVHFHYMPKQAGDNSSLKFLLKMYMANLKKPMAPSEMKEVCEKMKEAI